MEEWHATLQELRSIGSRVSRPENRPVWVDPSAPSGTQADQFLHAHYYQRTFENGKAMYATLFEKNKQRTVPALEDAMNWWRNLKEAPGGENRMLNETAPWLRKALSEPEIRLLDQGRLQEICMAVHAIKDYSRRVANKAVGLVDDGRRYTIADKVRALSARIWNDRSAGGFQIKDLLQYVLYGGPSEQLPERLWQAVNEEKWKIDGLGISALGELVGWAQPETFPPRNGRTSKALKSLGYDVMVHVE